MAESKRKGKAKKFNLEWIVKYGLEVSTRDPSTSEVTTVVCSFCRSFGREDEDAGRKRKRTMNANDADKEAHDCIISTIANLSLKSVSGISKVCAERDNRNNSGDHLPPVLQLEWCGVLLRDFVSCLEDQRIRLGHKFSETEVENIDEQFRKLRLAFKEHSGFSQMLLDAQASRAVQSFEKCWSQLGSEFEQLSMFCGAIASIMPSTSSVESDFSLINWTKDPNSQSLSDFSLESILHCKQYKKLRDLME
ncbi:hypothetical protein IV203_001702 [Nitzschia inconspicua]|uniref:Uncharacterized protein n=1 Tax=Nitzschia inconspicua TaxID=303405 RepID=A0A9K3PTU5_9STRA|nr:hypothetical protein IV203_001702 [Nitzschia inconspicua]